MTDKDKLYIDMCQEAWREINNNWKPKEGDRYYCRAGEFIGVLDKTAVLALNGETARAAFLPTQEDLQGMLEGSWIKKQVAFYDFIFKHASGLCACCFNSPADFKEGANFYEEAIGIIANTWGSFEQAWLAFVMHELYQKKWNGKIWA